MASHPTDERQTLKTVKAAFQIIETIKELNGATITEVATELSLPKTTVYRHLITLEQEGYLVKENGCYDISCQFLDIGSYVKTRTKAYQMAAERVGELANETGERAQFMVEEHGWAKYLHSESNDHLIRLRRRAGERVPIHVCAAGKAILAEYSDERIHEICDQHNLQSITEHTITDRELLFEDIEAIRGRGYSFNCEEHVEGMRAVGVAAKGPDNSVVGAFSVSGPTHRLNGDWFTDELPNLLIGAANEFRINLSHPV